MRSLKKISSVVFLFISLAVFSQTLGSNLDKTTLALGEIGTYTVVISGLQDKTVQAAPVNELLPFHFEEIKDSISIANDKYTRVIEFAIFEEGTFSIPVLEFNIGGEIQKTIPYEVEVVNTATKEDEINDIRENKEIPLQILDYWEMYKWYILAALAVIAIIFLIIMFRKYGRKVKTSPVVNTNKTLKELDLLRKKKYIENEDYRSFYVELMDISRNFITTQYRIPADVLLTDDLIEVLRNTNRISHENEKVIEEAFLRGDMVKFAKIFPTSSMMEEDFNAIRNFVKRSTKDLELEQLRTGV